MLFLEIIGLGLGLVGGGSAGKSGEVLRDYIPLIEAAVYVDQVRKSPCKRRGEAPVMVSALH